MTHLLDPGQSSKLKIFVSQRKNLAFAVALGISFGYSPSLLLLTRVKREVERVDKFSCLFF